jgi:hypothetical protein
MTDLSQIQDHLEAVRSHHGTVRIAIGNHTVNADILGTKFNEAADDVSAFLGASVQLRSPAHELIRMQETVIDALHNGDDPLAYLLTPQRTLWKIAETLDLAQTAQGDYIWTLGVKHFQ